MCECRGHQPQQSRSGRIHIPARPHSGWRTFLTSTVLIRGIDPSTLQQNTPRAHHIGEPKHRVPHSKETAPSLRTTLGP